MTSRPSFISMSTITPAKKMKKDKYQKIKSSSCCSKIIASSGDLPCVGSMSFDERKTLLVKTCDVISEHTKEMCTRLRTKADIPLMI